MTKIKFTEVPMTEVSLVPTEVSPADLRGTMVVETERRKLITEYIAHHMKAGVDYGSIKIGGRDSKPSLFKPGSEKFLSLFKLTATFRKDSETFEMAGSPNGLFCYVCEIKTNKGNIVGEGRGVAALAEKSWTVNSCVKIAQKRAQVDAVLRMGALSDFFTQDLEDMGPTYDHGPIKADAVPVVMGADEPEPIQKTMDKPWQKVTGKQMAEKSQVNALKAEIKEICDRVSPAPLLNKKDYLAYVKNTTNLDLADQTPLNLLKIKERLKTL